MEAHCVSIQGRYWRIKGRRNTCPYIYELFGTAGYRAVLTLNSSSCDARRTFPTVKEAQEWVELSVDLGLITL